MYARYKIAYIKMILNFNDEAALKFEEILNFYDSKYTPAVLGLAEAQFKASKVYFKQARYSRSLELRRKSLLVLKQCLKINADLCSIWKLFGDILTSLNDFDESCLTNFKEIFGDFLHWNEQNSSSKLNILTAAARCYMRAINLNPTVADLWHDLAVNFYFQTKLDEVNLHKGLECAKQAIRLYSSVSKYWATLGCLGTSSKLTSPAFVQFCFVKSLTIDPQNASAWTNLGLFYLIRNDNANLAHECFKKAQSVDPEFVNAWIGQALVAEKFAPQEAMDLFRHTTELANHVRLTNTVC